MLRRARRCLTHCGLSCCTVRLRVNRRSALLEARGRCSLRYGGRQRRRRTATAAWMECLAPNLLKFTAHSCCSDWVFSLSRDWHTLEELSRSMATPYFLPTFPANVLLIVVVVALPEGVVLMSFSVSVVAAAEVVTGVGGRSCSSKRRWSTSSLLQTVVDF